MRKKIFVFGIVLAAVMGAASVLSETPAAPSKCPRGSHLINCGDYSFCCPNNAFCICGP